LEAFYVKFDNNIYTLIATPLVLKERLLKGDLDFVLSTEDIQGDLITSLKLFDEKFVLISKDEIDLNEIQNYRWISFSEKDLIFQVFKKSSSKIVTIDSMSGIISLVKRGVGIAVIPSHVISNKDNLKITPVDSLKNSIYLSTLNYPEYPKYLKRFVSIVTTK
jgi:DNA-binding transcriptional LysR family regulator